jgi:hypothetical protein
MKARLDTDPDGVHMMQLLKVSGIVLTTTSQLTLTSNPTLTPLIMI